MDGAVSDGSAGEAEERHDTGLRGRRRRSDAAASTRRRVDALLRAAGPHGVEQAEPCPAAPPPGASGALRGEGPEPVGGDGVASARSASRPTAPRPTDAGPTGRHAWHEQAARGRDHTAWLRSLREPVAADPARLPVRPARAAPGVPAGAPPRVPAAAPQPAAPRERVPDRGPAPPPGGPCGLAGRADAPRAPGPSGARDRGPSAPERRPGPPAPVSHTEPRSAPAATRPVAPTRGPSLSPREHLPPGAVGVAADRPPPTGHAGSPPDERDDAAAGAGRRWAALRDRLPLWVRLRCGLDPRALTALVVVLVAAALFAGQHFWAAGPRQVPVPETLGPGGTRSQPLPHLEPASAAVPPPSLAAPAGPRTRIVVDVGGKVRRPGVFHLPAGSRVQDALKAAGGAEEGADLTGLNRARILVDGEQVVVGLPLPAGEPAPGSAAPGAATGPISLNTATAEQLETLPGVGPVLAGHIIDHRTRTGGFRSVDELRDVTGIGERRFAELQHRVTP